jgi:predicted RNA binding protein YcfA (HicA-like mRNA interferase family)
VADSFDRELKELLEGAGCHYVRPGKGSHQIWHSPITQRSFPVPVGIKSRHTANSILKQAGIAKKL